MAGKALRFLIKKTAKKKLKRVSRKAVEDAVKPRPKPKLKLVKKKVTKKDKEDLLKKKAKEGIIMEKHIQRARGSRMEGDRLPLRRVKVTEKSVVRKIKKMDKKRK